MGNLRAEEVVEVFREDILGFCVVLSPSKQCHQLSSVIGYGALGNTRTVGQIHSLIGLLLIRFNTNDFGNEKVFSKQIQLKGRNVGAYLNCKWLLSRGGVKVYGSYPGGG